MTVSRQDFDKLTPEEIDVEVEERRKLIAGMVGTLYPSILSDEIADLMELRPKAVERMKATRLDRAEW